MEKEYKKIKEKIIEYKDKRVLVLSTIGINFQPIIKSIGVGEIYEKVFDDLLIENYGYIYTRYINDNEKKKIEELLEIKKGLPLFSHKIIDSDIVIFININPSILKIFCTIGRVSYNQALNLQKSLKEKLNNISCPVIKINLYSNSIDIKNVARNVFILDEHDYNFLNRKELKEEYDTDIYYFRFPYIKKVNTLEELKRKQGFLLIINEKYLEVSNYIEIDKKYRNFFKQFNLVYIITHNKLKHDLFHLKFSNIYFVEEAFFDYEDLQNIYFDYILNTKKTNFSKKKLLLLNEMNNYLKTKKTIKTDEIAKTFKIIPRKVERYMNDYNKIYKNIGYDYTNNEWYTIK